MSTTEIQDLWRAYRDLGVHLGPDHIPAPEPHRPNVETIVSDGWHGIVLKEQQSGAFIHCENPREIRQ